MFGDDSSPSDQIVGDKLSKENPDFTVASDKPFDPNSDPYTIK